MPTDYQKIIYLVTPVVAAQIADDSITNIKINSAAAIAKSKIATASTFAESDIPTLAKSKISGTGTFAESDIPTLAKSKISATGTWGTAEIPDISATYSVKAGNSDLVTVGTITTGHWHGDVIDENKVPTTYTGEITFSVGIKCGDLKFKNGWVLTEDGPNMVLVKGKRKVRLT